MTQHETQVNMEVITPSVLTLGVRRCFNLTLKLVGYFLPINLDRGLNRNSHAI